MEQGPPARQDAAVVEYATRDGRQQQHPWLPAVRVASLAALVYGVCTAAIHAVGVLVYWRVFGSAGLVDDHYFLFAVDTGVTTSGPAGGVPLIELCVALAGGVLALAGWLCWNVRPRGRSLMVACCVALLMFTGVSGALSCWGAISLSFALFEDSGINGLSVALAGLNTVRAMLLPAILLALMTRPGARAVFGR